MKDEININLLPWRQKLRAAQKTKFFVCWVVSLAIVLLFSIFLHIAYKWQIVEQENHLVFLERQLLLIKGRSTTLKLLEKLKRVKQPIYILKLEKSK